MITWYESETRYRIINQYKGSDHTYKTQGTGWHGVIVSASELDVVGSNPSQATRNFDCLSWIGIHSRAPASGNKGLQPGWHHGNRHKCNWIKNWRKNWKLRVEYKTQKEKIIQFLKATGLMNNIKYNNVKCEHKTNTDWNYYTYSYSNTTITPPTPR